MDPLSSIISLLRPHDCVASGLDAGGDWAIQFDRHPGLKCNAVLKGVCWLSVEGVDAPQPLEAGDCVILPKGRPFLLSARAGRLGADANTIYAPVPHGGTAVYGGGGDFFMTGSRFLLSGFAADGLLGALPPVVLLRQGAQREAVRWSVDRIAQELRQGDPGSALSIAHLSHFVLLQVMRHHLAQNPAEGAGWMAALADPHISLAVAAIHGDPAHPWTVRDLAAHAALSRTSFAVRFKHVAGQTPLEYVTTWRMLIAADRLRRSDTPVARIAADVGYTSQSAFAVAFKRTLGQTPRAYARSAG